MKKKNKVKIAPPIGETYLNETIFRKGTKHPVRVFNFFLRQGGLGDYICHMPAFEYMAEMFPQVYGRLFANPPFTDVAKHIMKKYPHWDVHKVTQAEKVMKPGEMMFDPSKYIKYVSAPGAHLLDLGFIYYCNQQAAVEPYNRMTSLKGLTHNFELPERYAVVTPGATAKARTMPAEGFNAVCEHLISRGVTPVFLGKKDFAHMGADSSYFAKIDQEYNLDCGVNLLEQTTLLEAVAVMEGALMVVGLDNGLLHFAGCTDVPIIFGHSVTEVHHREIRRKRGKTINIALRKEDLACYACQSRMRFVIGHAFKYCIYDDYKCLDLLFSNKAEAWARAIDEILKNY
jgi:hypothetical protein